MNENVIHVPTIRETILSVLVEHDEALRGYQVIVDQAVNLLEEREGQLSANIAEVAAEQFDANRIEVLLALQNIGMEIITTPAETAIVDLRLSESQKQDVSNAIDAVVADVKARLGI